MTIPKLPPPPRTPQKSSLFSSSLAVHELTIRRDEVDGEQGVDREPELPHEVADPPAQREPGQSRVRDEAGRDGKPEGLGFPIQVAEERAGLGADGPGLGIDADALHEAEVDDHPLVAYREPGIAVTSASYSDHEAVRPGEAH